MYCTIGVGVLHADEVVGKWVDVLYTEACVSYIWADVLYHEVGVCDTGLMNYTLGWMYNTVKLSSYAIGVRNWQICVHK